MRSEIDALLSRELGHLGGPGAGWVARLLPANVDERTLHLGSSSEETRKAVESVLKECGRLIPETVGDPGSVSAIIGSGRMRLNPALVTVSVIETPAGAEVRIRGVAKEGLVKQRGGEQVAAEVADAIAKAVAT
jgi:hypothetical protein